MLLELTDVTKTFDRPDSGEKLHVLRGISLVVKKGDSLAVIGPSGSGKSTLLNIMGGLDCPTAGHVLFRRNDVAHLEDRERAALRNREIGFVFQLHHLLPQCTVLENVLVPTVPLAGRDDGEPAHERALRLLSRVGLAERAAQFPSRLSGGERQRVAVVRALINHPSLLLADEPTGSLDRATASEIGELLVELNVEQKTALVVVTHSDELAGHMARRYTLREGRLLRDTR